ncbi:S9 family peptidase [Gaopeijia maritima]|uniref:DPP IV N-terminal domain-containing protein n=1 Tax=Gaopeijia maritima TaxID=3119007 RepID=A0ABU9E765_9BACT
MHGRTSSSPARARARLHSLAAVAVVALAGAAPLDAQMPRQPEAPRPLGWVGGPGSANQALAARWAPYRVSDLIYGTTVSPRWIEGSESFWYSWDTAEGTFWRIVDPASGTRRDIFDRDRIAAELTRITGDPYEARHLPIRSIRFIDPGTLRFEVESSQDEEVEEDSGTDEVDEDQQEEQRRSSTRTEKKVHYFEYDVGTRTLTELDEADHPDNHPSWASVSPDGAWVVFGREHDLWMMSGDDYARVLDARRGKSGSEADSLGNAVEVDEIRLTDDGVEFYGWYTEGRGDTDDEREESADERKRAPISWSKDSRRFALVRSDQREVDELWVIHSTGNDRPQLETYKYDMPGEENVTRNEVWVYDLESREAVKIDDDPWKDQSMSVLTDQQFIYPDDDSPRRSLWLGDSSDELWLMRLSRDRHRTDVFVADASTGALLRTVVADRMNTYMETRSPILLEGGDLLWWSEVDGWAHLYRYAPDGTLRGQLTEGPFSVQSIVGVDEDSGTVFFTAAGREEGDPYYQHLYRVGLDGSGLRLLNPGEFDTRVSASESRRFFVESHSRVDTAPSSRVLDAEGNVVVELEEADFSQLLAAGYRFPEPFTVKADDGVTDLYGVMYKPFDFDSTKVYPLVEYVYPGPQTESVAKSFSTSSSEVGLAQFGMIVITIGNRGGHPSRSKWYHNYGYGNLRDYGLADKKVAAEQLADRHPFIDLERVGIYGHSGGGFMSTAAMLVYPDFFKVAVSSSGNHENDVYNRWWSETHHGVDEVTDDEGNVTFEYDIDGNSELAANLKGHLLLTTGDIDNNVHPAGTYRMAEALIRAGKRFDFFLFPGQRHGYGNMSDYWFWLRAEYFVRHLLGDPHWNADIVPLQRERPRTR